MLNYKKIWNKEKKKLLQLKINKRIKKEKTVITNKPKGRKMKKPNLKRKATMKKKVANKKKKLSMKYFSGCRRLRRPRKNKKLTYFKI